MKRHITFCAWVAASLFLIVFQAFAQPPDSLWSRTYGGSSTDRCYSVQQTTDGGYILGGDTYSYGAGSYDFWLVKTNANGDSLWSRTFGGSDNDRCYSVQQTTDGGYILGGLTYSYGAGQADIWLVKTDANGDTTWTRTFGGSNWDYCYSVQQTSDGGYVLGGKTDSYGAGSEDFWLVKTDANGDTLWTRTFGGSGSDPCHSVQQTTDGGYILGGFTGSYGAGSFDFWLVKTDVSGTEEWRSTFGGSSSEACYSVQQTSDGGYILGGKTDSYGAGGSDFWLVKTDANGDSLWSRTFGGSSFDECWSVQQTTDGGYILGGFTESYGAGNYDFWLVGADANGDSLWSHPFGGSDYDFCQSVQQTTDGDYILGGITSSYGAGSNDFWLVKTAFSSPFITSITDVGNDQGRQVRIRWNRCIYDGFWPDYVIEDYNIYRRIDQYLTEDDGKTRYGGLDWPPGEWEFITTVPAFEEETYAAICPTLADSSSEGIYWSTFFIRAGTSNPGTYFDSEPDSGYSIDNLPPDVTMMTAMVPTSPNTVKLQWQEVTTGGGGQPEQGDVWYQVYGSTDPMFTPAPENLLIVTQSLEFLHNTGANDKYFYIIQASDDH